MRTKATRRKRAPARHTAQYSSYVPNITPAQRAEIDARREEWLRRMDTPEEQRRMAEIQYKAVCAAMCK